MRRWPHLLAVGAVALAGVAGVSSAEAGGNLPQRIDVNSLSDGDPIPGRYVVIMDEEPLVTTYGQDGLASNAAKNAGRGLKKGHQKALAEAGVPESTVTASYTVALNGFAAELSEAQAAKLAGTVGVATVIQDVWREAQTDNSGDFLGLTEPGGMRASGFDGEGVIVGIIDNGIWPEHPSFADDGSYSDLGLVLADSPDFPACDFGNVAHNPNDAPFECNNKLLGARQMLDGYRGLVGADVDEFDSARDDDGHGTHTASTAAGNAGVGATILGVDRGVITGVAPRARIIAYKGLGELGGLGSDLAAAIDAAVADGVDVINYSIGSSSFALGPDDIAFLFAADAGVFVATSNGNSGPAPATTGSPASAPWVTSVGASTQDRTFQGSASSSDGWEFFGESVTDGTDELPLVDAADAGNELCLPGGFDEGAVAGKIVLCLRGAIARVGKGFAVSEAGGEGMILYNANDGQSQVTDTHFLPAVHINNTDGLVVKDYIATAESPVAQINAGAIAPAQGSVMAGFSSRGPNRLSGDIIKPDVTAPGVNILAGASPFPYGGQSVQGQLFQSISGTSMSSPHVAGLFALMKQAHPGWSASAAKSALMTTARQDVVKEDGITPADAFDMGSGHVDPSGSPFAKNSIFNPGLVYEAGFFEYLGFLCDADPASLNPTTCPFLESIGVPTDASQLNLASIGVADLAGSETIVRTVTNVSGEELRLKAEIDAPDGYRVQVSPQTLIIPAGGAAAYEVTITNRRAPAGVWRHGSVTLTEGGSGNGEGRGSGKGNGKGQGQGSGRYEVYTPLAVKGAVVGFPAAVGGTGTDGAIEFDVAFGYSGDYSAAGHGLVPATVTSGAVAQDPDQDFDPTDGYSDEVVVSTSGAALLRFAMPPEAVPGPDVDIDLFLADPEGNIVATSTNGGTDEFIEIVLPEDGEWTLYVHGWQTIDDPVAYDLYHWVVSATPGGNLSVDAPTSANVGSSATVTASWAGAADEQWHLGAVSHSNADGLLGLTLVEVDNR